MSEPICSCGHIAERHNDGESGAVEDYYQGNCRMCDCPAFLKAEYRSHADLSRRPVSEKLVPVDDPTKLGIFRHLNAQIDKLQRVIGQIYLLSQKDVENGRYEAYNDARRLQRVNVLAGKAIYDD